MSQLKKLQFRDLKPIIKEKFRDYLNRKKLCEGRVLPEEYQGKYAFGAYSKSGEDDWFLFNLMIIGERPEDAIMVLEADVSRFDGQIKAWRCYDDAFRKCMSFKVKG